MGDPCPTIPQLANDASGGHKGVTPAKNELILIIDSFLTTLELAPKV